PRYKGHEDLTSSPPSSELTPAVSYESPALPAGNIGRGLRSLRDLTHELTTAMHHLCRTLTDTISLRLFPACQTLVRFFALLRIKQHAPPLVRAPVNSFEF